MSTDLNALKFIFLIKKATSLKFSKTIKKIHEHKNYCIRQLQSNDKNEYNNHAFQKRFFEKTFNENL